MSEKISVLLVEDDSMLVEMYAMKFQTEGFDVHIAGNGIEGLRVLDENEVPDIILLDVIMPQMDGFTMLKKIKEDKKFNGIPVVLLTNLGQENDVKRGKELGADDYLVKADLTPQQVVDKVHEIVKR